MIENARRLEEDVQRRLTMERELRAARASLETRVAERTAELEQANESLQHEIFERQVTERQLRLKDFAIASSILGIVFTDLDGQIEYANSSFRRLWGYGPDDHTEGTHLLQLWSTEEGGHDVLEVLARSRSYVGEVMARRRDGSRFEAQLSASVVLDEHGGPLRIMASFLDLSESKRAERAREALEAQLRQSQKMESLGSLAGGVAHDMNNMLTAVMGLVCSIQSELGPQSPVQAELESILTACRRGSDLSKNLLGFARKGSYSRQRLSPVDVVKEVEDLLSRTIPKGILLRTETSLGRSLIVGDASQLQHMLLNLALNSVRAMGDRGELTLAADEVGKPETIGGLRPGRYVRLQVRDTGRGMTSEVLQRAFEPFFTTKGPGEGSGLGLSMVYGTVKNHGGEVVLQSTEGRGTVATVYLPAVEGTPNESPPVPAVAPSDRRPGTVLLVDDEELIRQAARRLLQRLGYEVLEAENGAVAVSLISEQRGKVDVVVLDLVMPVMDGEEAFYRLRELDPELPILLSSGHAREHVAGALLEQGARGFLKKPYTREELAQALQQACAGAPARR